MKHSWSDDDNLVAYCLYRLGNREHTFGMTPAELGTLLGMGSNSLSIKVANFKAVDGAGGMNGYSRQAEAIEKRYKSVPDSELRALGISIIGKALDRHTNGS